MSTLVQTLTTGKLCDNSVAILVGYFDKDRQHFIGSSRLANLSPDPLMKEVSRASGRRYTHQVEYSNLTPIPQLQVGPGFKLRRSVYMTAETTREPISMADDSILFNLSCHLK